MTTRDVQQRFTAIQDALRAALHEVEALEQENRQLQDHAQVVSKLREGLATTIALQFARDVVRRAGNDLRALNTAHSDFKLYLPAMFDDQGPEWLAVLEKEFDKATRIEAMQVPALRLWNPALAAQEVDAVAAPPDAPPAAAKILFLAANPPDTPRLKLDEEIRTIQHSLREADYRERFSLVQEWAVRTSDLTGALLRHRPHVVHFSGHGTEAGELILKDDSGRSRPVSARFLGQLFSTLHDNIRCVVLNVCYSERQAHKIAEFIDCVVGMPLEIGDEAALAFSAAFYQALGYGRSVQTAFMLGLAQVDAEELAEESLPRLLSLRSNCAEIVLV